MDAKVNAMSFDPEYPVDDPRGRAQRALAGMLSAGDNGAVTLERWLVGEGLYLQRDEEAYEGILRGVPLGRDRPAATRALAQMTATIIGRKLDSSDDPESAQLLFNLFMLAAELSFPDFLAEPLFDFYSKGTCEGSWQGFFPKDALLFALTMNQLDARLRALWSSLLDRTASPLPGTPYDGFRGVLRMPADATKRGQPSMVDLGQSMTKIAHHIASSCSNPREREARFRRVLEEIREVYAAPPDLNLNLIFAAQENDLPEWAVTLLPTHYWRPTTEQHSPPQPEHAVPRWARRITEMLYHLGVPRSRTGEETKIFRRIVPSALARSLPDEYCSSLKVMCHGHLTEIKTSMEEVAGYLDLVAPEADEARRGSPFRSPTSIEAVIDGILLRYTPDLNPTVTTMFPNMAPKIGEQRLKSRRHTYTD